MKIFVDTEFTDFMNCHLISLGAVTEDGKHEFYVEIEDYPQSAESSWVRENVIPLLNGHDKKMTRLRAADALFCWITKLQTQCSICVDYITDWDLTVDLLDELWPLNLSTEPEMLYSELQAKTVMRHMSKDLMLTAGAMPEISLSESITGSKKVFSEQFLEHFFQNRNEPGYLQHHALYDARANRQGYVAALEYIKNL